MSQVSGPFVRLCACVGNQYLLGGAEEEIGFSCRPGTTNWLVLSRRINPGKDRMQIEGELLLFFCKARISI